MDWILRRVFTTLVKRSLGRLLKHQPDLDRVDVQLKAGKVIQLRSVLLNCDYLSEQLAFAGVEVTAGFVSRIELSVEWPSPTTSFGVQVELGEVLLTLRPAPGGPSRAPVQLDEPDDPDGLGSDEESELGATGVLTGQQTLTSWLEGIARKLRVVVVDSTIRFEVPGADGAGEDALVFHADRIEYRNSEDVGGVVAEDGAADGAVKSITFGRVAVEVEQGAGAGEGGGAQGRMCAMSVEEGAVRWSRQAGE
eukprot:evm.model.scf_1714.2 EVM.evm.TU.scf_1714.2   scf_1714:21383-22798(-)